MFGRLVFYVRQGYGRAEEKLFQAEKVFGGYALLVRNRYMKQPKALSEKRFTQLVDLVHQQQQIVKDMMQWDMSNTLQESIASQMAQITTLLSALVSGANEVTPQNLQNLCTLGGPSMASKVFQKVPLASFPRFRKPQSATEAPPSLPATAT